MTYIFLNLKLTFKRFYCVFILFFYLLIFTWFLLTFRYLILNYWRRNFLLFIFSLINIFLNCFMAHLLKLSLECVSTHVTVANMLFWVINFRSIWVDFQIFNLKLLAKKFWTFQILFVGQFIFKLLYRSFALVELRVCLHTCYSSKYAFLSLNHFRLRRFLIVI